MRNPGRPRRGGLTLVEMVITMTIAAVAAGIVIQVLVLTVRTTEQASTQADVQERARRALAEWETELRDGYAVLRDYTLRTAPYTTYVTQITADEQTVVVAAPSVDGGGTVCAWRGIPVVHDCLIWQAVRSPEGTWALTRRVVTNAFQMPVSYFATNTPSPHLIFRSLLWGQVSPPPAPFTVPSTFARDDQAGPSLAFSGAGTLQIQLWGGASLIAPNGAVVAPPVVATASVLPCYVDAAGSQTGTPMAVTDVAVVRIHLRFAEQADAMMSGRGPVTQSDTQTAAVRLRNKPVW